MMQARQIDERSGVRVRQELCRQQPHHQNVDGPESVG